MSDVAGKGGKYDIDLRSKLASTLNASTSLLQALASLNVVEIGKKAGSAILSLNFSNLGGLVPSSDAGFEIAKKAIPAAGVFRAQQYEVHKLVLEIETAKERLKTMKEEVNRALRLDLPMCTLSALVDGINAFQMTFYNDFIKRDMTQLIFLIKWPEWYRVQLQAAIQDLDTYWQAYMSEKTSYIEIVTEQLSKRSKLKANSAEGIISTIRQQLIEQKGKCSKEMERIKSIREWDDCPVCTDRDVRVKTSVESYRSHTRKTIDEFREKFRKIEKKDAETRFDESDVEAALEEVEKDTSHSSAIASAKAWVSGLFRK